jgi:hypothetical protein
MNSARLAAVLATAIMAVACGGTTTTMSEVAGPDVVRCQTSIANTPSAVPHTGSQVSLTIVAERECSWTARSEATWAQVSPASGQGQATIAVTVTANTATSGRATAIVVNDTRLNLNQEAAPCRFELGHTRSLMSSEGGRTAVNVATSGDCAWSASSNSAWARVANASGPGPARSRLASHRIPAQNARRPFRSRTRRWSSSRKRDRLMRRPAARAARSRLTRRSGRSGRPAVTARYGSAQTTDAPGTP